MTRKMKPVEADLDEEIQAAVMSLPVRLPDESLATVGDLVERAAECLRLANEAVQDNALIRTTATFLMKQEKRRGTPTVLVRMDGTAVLRITYGDDEEDQPPVAVVAATSKKAKLPTLDELRKRAAAAGVDISDLGRQKRKILARVEDGEEAAPSSRNPMRDEVNESDLPAKVSLPSRNR